jgi:hypothetical protein
MVNRKGLLGLALLCALCSCAAFAQSAFAEAGEKEGTTFVTCRRGGTTNDFTREHCAPADKVAQGKGEFSHFKVPSNVHTTITGSNGGTGAETTGPEPAILTSKIAGVEVELKCTTVASRGIGETNEIIGPPITHTISGNSIIVTYSGCTVPKPVGQECKVKAGQFVTNGLIAMDEEMGIRFTAPVIGGVKLFTTITIEGCKTAGFNGEKKVTGSVLGTPFGATLKVLMPFGPESTLEFAGQKAGLIQTETLKGRVSKELESEETEPFTPLSVTTTPLVLGG